eukprot:TRINITY_DN14148_c0_g1_i1.p1 TRINITY_DN14148_c0_g1~~TRINITY_DN14148_c0_g1_i1.p1  ORF type:complete len:673 (+),score=127.33 TRINITY_DN14148_c0_g1_i1:55-2073(+)
MAASTAVSAGSDDVVSDLPLASTVLPLLHASSACRLLDACNKHWRLSGDIGTGEAAEWCVHDVLPAVRAAADRFASRLCAALVDECLLAEADVCLQFASSSVHKHSNGKNEFVLLVRGRRPHGKSVGQQDGVVETWELPDLAAVANFCCNLSPNKDECSTALEQEFRNAIENESLGIIFRDRVWAAASQPASFWASPQNVADDAQSLEARLLAGEQFAAFAGHPFHVMAKMRMPLTFDDAIAFAPEFAPTVKIRILAVRAEFVRVWPSLIEWKAFWAEHCPAAVKQLETEVPNEEAASFVLLPIHPLNLSKAQALYQTEFDGGCMRILSADTGYFTAKPTLSFRTVAPHGGSCAFDGYRVKLPVPLLATSLPRYVSPVEVRGSVLVGRALKQMQLPDELAVQREDFAVHLRFVGDGGDDPPGHHSYEDARYCSAIFRQSPVALARRCGGRGHVLLAAMFSKRSENGSTLWPEFWRHHSVVDGSAWFESYVDVVLRAQLGIFLRFGVALEAHQQNTVLEFGSDGRLERIIYQELGGGIFWDPERLACFPELDFRHKVYSRDDLFVPTEKCLACVRHSMLRMHLLLLANEVAAFFHLRTVDLRRRLADLIRAAHGASWAAQDVSDQLSPEIYSRNAAQAIEALLNWHRRQKALLRMRIQQSKEEIYVDSAVVLD